MRRVIPVGPEPRPLREPFTRARRARDDVAEATAEAAGFRGDDAPRDYLVTIRVRKIGDPTRSEREILSRLGLELPMIFDEHARVVGAVRRAARG